MANVNKWIGVGRIGKMETRYTAEGAPVTNFSLAVNDPYGKKEKGEDTDWFNCVAFKKTAEVLKEHAKVGKELYVEGRVKMRPWEKDGVRQYKTEVVVESVQLLGSKDKDEAPKEREQPKKSASAPQAGGGAFSDFDQDIPFACPRGAVLNVI